MRRATARVNGTIITGTDVEQRVAAVEQQTPDRLDQRLAALEQQAPNATRAAAWVDRAVWAAAAAAVMYIAKSAGLLH